MTSHVTKIGIQIACDAQGQATAGVRYRWVCSCGRFGVWRASDERGRGAGAAARSARAGGVKHVAAMERGE